MPQFPSPGYKDKDILSLKNYFEIHLKSDYTKQGQSQGARGKKKVKGHLRHEQFEKQDRESSDKRNGKHHNKNMGFTAWWFTAEARAQLSPNTIDLGKQSFCKEPLHY